MNFFSVLADSDNEDTVKVVPKKGAAPTKKDAAPTKKDAAPVKKDAAPAKKDAAPAKKDAAPAKKAGTYFLCTVCCRSYYMGQILLFFIIRWQGERA